MERQSLEVSRSMCKSRKRGTEGCCNIMPYQPLLRFVHRAMHSDEVQGTALNQHQNSRVSEDHLTSGWTALQSGFSPASPRHMCYCAFGTMLQCCRNVNFG